MQSVWIVQTTKSLETSLHYSVIPEKPEIEVISYHSTLESANAAAKFHARYDEEYPPIEDRLFETEERIRKNGCYQYSMDLRGFAESQEDVVDALIEVKRKYLEGPPYVAQDIRPSPPPRGRDDDRTPWVRLYESIRRGDENLDKIIADGLDEDPDGDEDFDEDDAENDNTNAVNDNDDEVQFIREVKRRRVE